VLNSALSDFGHKQNFGWYWQIDVPESTLRCRTDTNRLRHLDTATTETLFTFGYPHTPIFDIHFSENARSKAMFDTGYTAYLAISPPDSEGAGRNGGIAQTLSGYGSLGSSMGGAAPNAAQHQVQLMDFSIGNIPLGRVDATVRESSPSLIGASILEHYVVTLDAREAKAYFDAYRNGPYRSPSFGFGLSFEDDVAVSLIWEHSPAATAGLKVGDVITSINGQPVSASCDGMRQLMRVMSEANSLDVEWNGGVETLTRDLPEGAVSR
jgi:S1-C subfamily serine protease